MNANTFPKGSGEETVTTSLMTIYQITIHKKNIHLVKMCIAVASIHSVLKSKFQYKVFNLFKKSNGPETPISGYLKVRVAGESFAGAKTALRNKITLKW